MTAGTATAGPPVVLDGTGLSCEKVCEVAREGRLVTVGQAGLRRARRARATSSARSRHAPYTAGRPAWERTARSGSPTAVTACACFAATRAGRANAQHGPGPGHAGRPAQPARGRRLGGGPGAAARAGGGAEPRPGPAGPRGRGDRHR